MEKLSFVVLVLADITSSCAPKSELFLCWGVKVRVDSRDLVGVNTG